MIVKIVDEQSEIIPADVLVQVTFCTLKKKERQEVLQKYIYDKCWEKLKHRLTKGAENGNPEHGRIARLLVRLRAYINSTRSPPQLNTLINILESIRDGCGTGNFKPVYTTLHAKFQELHRLVHDSANHALRDWLLDIEVIGPGRGKGVTFNQRIRLVGDFNLCIAVTNSSESPRYDRQDPEIIHCC